MSRVLVTGAGGFVGHPTLGRLLESGFEVHAVTSRPEPLPSTSGVRWHRVDLLTSGPEAELLARVAPTHLLHLAWYAEPGEFWRATENLRWVEASLRLLRAFVSRGGGRAVVAGTCAEYEWHAQTHCIECITPLRPATLYGVSKHALHLLAERYAQEVGLSLAWGRVFFLFGPREDERRLAAGVASSLLRGEPAPCSEGEQVRDFMCVSDLADAFVALLRSDVRGAVNMASGQPLRLRDLVEEIARQAGRLELVQRGAHAGTPDEPGSLTADVGRLRDEVGWSGPASLTQRVEETVAWWREELERRRLTSSSASPS